MILILEMFKKNFHKFFPTIKAKGQAKIWLD